MPMTKRSPLMGADTAMGPEPDMASSDLMTIITRLGAGLQGSGLTGVVPQIAQMLMQSKLGKRSPSPTPIAE